MDLILDKREIPVKKLFYLRKEVSLKNISKNQSQKCKKYLNAFFIINLTYLNHLNI